MLRLSFFNKFAFIVMTLELIFTVTNVFVGLFMETNASLTEVNGMMTALQ